MVGFVTGASRGLGLELVRLGLEKGYKMVAGWIGDELEGTQLYELSKTYGDQLLICQMDVTDSWEVQNGIRLVEATFGQIDFVVNNAGVLFESKYDTRDPIVDLDIDKFTKTLAVNTIGPAIVLKFAMPLLYESKQACIINISSEAGHLTPGGYGYMLYSISKHGLNMYTQKIRNYLKEVKSSQSIRIFMVHPGRMQTVMGAENAQIQPTESAEGIYHIIEGTIDPDMPIPFINYKGEAMPY